ncbi:MAG: pirin family protein [Alphaproteobacteria bacterium]|nr:pirin family protein [Alphaproteobacteria bacterium]
MPLKPTLTPPANGPTFVRHPGRPAHVGAPVMRLLPTAGRRTIGPWAFVDHFGPTVPDAPIDVPPHPHCGLATVTWLFEGEGLHKDSLGTEQRILPGQLNWMTAAHGIAHSEEMPAGRAVHGLQLWLALPPEHRDAPPRFEHHASLPDFAVGGVSGTVLAGSLAGATSPASVQAPTLAAIVTVEGSARLDVPPGFELGVVPVSGAPSVAGEPVRPGELVYLGVGRDTLVLDGSGTLLLLGGAPYPEPLLVCGTSSSARLRSCRAQRRIGTPTRRDSGQCPTTPGAPGSRPPSCPDGCGRPPGMPIPEPR